MRKFILGTDWWTDCDDAVALRLLARAVKKNEIELLGVAINGCMEYTVPSLDGFLHAEGVAGVPIGLDKEANDFGGCPPYQKNLAPLAVAYKTNEEAENPVRLYRRLLAAAEDASVELVEIGYMQTIAALLQSGPDDLSPKNGVELVAEKVKKLWVMAGKWDDNPGRENNFARNRRTSAGSEALCRLCPVPMVFLGWEIGHDVITGGLLPEDDLLHKALADHGSANGRMSWDPMLVALALEGDEERAGYNVVRGTATVDAETGLNTFAKDPAGSHAYVVRKFAPEWYADKINAMIG